MTNFQSYCGVITGISLLIHLKFYTGTTRTKGQKNLRLACRVFCYGDHILFINSHGIFTLFSWLMCHALDDSICVLHEMKHGHDFGLQYGIEFALLQQERLKNKLLNFLLLFTANFVAKNLPPNEDPIMFKLSISNPCKNRVQNKVFISMSNTNNIRRLAGDSYGIILLFQSLVFRISQFLSLIVYNIWQLRYGRKKSKKLHVFF